MGEAKKTIDSMNFENISAVLLDVAGTTTAINFVKETLYPYVVKNVESFLKTNWEDEDVKKAVSQLETPDLDVSKAAELVTSLTEKDDKNIGLKTIQGLLFKKGYESGEIKGHLFADVSKSFESWSKSKKIAVFSTGSMDSQQLLFKYTVEGDLSSHISKYFDQTIGAKTDAESYKKIAAELKIAPENIIFLTDDTKEAEAAKSADFKVLLVEREGNASIPEEFATSFVVVQSFSDVPLESVKRKLEEESVEAPPVKVAKIEDKSNVDSETVEKTEEIKKTDEDVKKQEGMEVDVEEKTVPTETDKDKAEIVEKPEEKSVPAEKVESEKMECNNETEKSDNETQTKMVTNECETQTTISIKAAEELPIETVKDKLMEDKEKIEGESEQVTANETKETAETNKDELPIDKVEKTIENGDKCDVEVKNKEETKEIEEKTEENGEIPKENGVTEAKSDIVEEKENKSELANGKEKSIDEVVDTNGEAKEEEVKVKVMEGAPVSVEA